MTNRAPLLLYLITVMDFHSQSLSVSRSVDNQLMVHQEHQPLKKCSKRWSVFFLCKSPAQEEPTSSLSGEEVGHVIILTLLLARQKSTWMHVMEHCPA